MQCDDIESIRSISASRQERSPSAPRSSSLIAAKAVPSASLSDFGLDVDGEVAGGDPPRRLGHLLEVGDHRAEGVGGLAELVARADLDLLLDVAGRDPAGGADELSQPARDLPSEQEREPDRDEHADGDEDDRPHAAAGDDVVDALGVRAVDAGGGVLDRAEARDRDDPEREHQRRDEQEAAEQLRADAGCHVRASP